ncbi:hypothetical protein [Flagellimonas iocasae]|uniref:Inovirus Gp2 family protein n=1 Tax=Flagellimonas iocasae TaxID=2055905 RepID=A0ABW4XXA4_9FLAO
MDKVICTIRKWDYRGNKRYNPSIKNLNKQIHTLHKKLKKKDTVYTTYTIERDEGRNGYHVHSLFQYKDKENLHENLQKFVGGDINKKGSFDTCFGKWGTIFIDDVRDENQYNRYMNKFVNRTSKTLV